MRLSNYPTDVSSEDLRGMENSVVLMHDRSSKATSVDVARSNMFSQKQHSHNAIPLMRTDLMEHAKCAA